jgi:recombination protein U
MANRGKQLEKRIETVNEHYIYLELAEIQFIPTPMGNIKQPDGSSMAIYKKKSTVDFIGTMTGGRSVAFDAKETELETRYELKQIEPHQIEFLTRTHKLGGAAFFLIEFKAFNELYYVPLPVIKEYWDTAQQHKGKFQSIPYSAFKEIGHLVKQGRGVALDYLAHIN